MNYNIIQTAQKTKVRKIQKLCKSFIKFKKQVESLNNSDEHY